MYARDNTHQLGYPSYPSHQFSQPYVQDYNPQNNGYLSNPTVVHHTNAIPPNATIGFPQEEIFVHQHHEISEVQDTQPVHKIVPAPVEVRHIHHTVTENRPKSGVKLKRYPVKWIPRKKLDLAEFETFYSMALVEYISSAEYSELIDQCTLRFRKVAKPWRTFWAKQKKLMPAEFLAAIFTLCLSMAVTTPLWYRMYGKAKKKTEREESLFKEWLQRMNRDVWLQRGYQLKLTRPKRQATYAYTNNRTALENVQLVIEFFG